MALRLSPKHDAMTRDKIKTSQLVNRLQAFALEDVDGKTGKVVEMSRDRMTAAIALLRKTMPDLLSTTLSGEGGGPIPFVIFGEREAKDSAAWQEANPPPA